jgi:hypothetical protein
MKDYSRVLVGDRRRRSGGSPDGHLDRETPADEGSGGDPILQNSVGVV